MLLVPKGQRESVSELISAMETKVGFYIAGQGALCLVISIMALVAYLLIGLPNALVLALVAGVMEAVPMIGPLLGAIPAAVVAISIAPSKLVWVVVAMLVVQQIENSVLVPRVMRKAVGVNPFVSLLAIFAFSSLLGFAGALMAIPLAAILQLFLDRFVFHPAAMESEGLAGRNYASRLRYEVQDLAQDLRKQARLQKGGSDLRVNQTHFERLWLSLLPSGQRKQARDIWQTVESEIGAYIRGEVIQSLLAGLLLGLGYWLLGSPNPALLALASALACLIPVIGAALAVISVFVVGLLTSLQLSLFTALYALGVLIALGVWVKPRLFNRRWDNPILTVVLLIALAGEFGLVGIIVAPPLSVICQILWSHLVSRRAVSGAAAQVSDLKERQARVRDAIRAMDGPPLALVSSSMERLSSLIQKAEPILQPGLPGAGLPLEPSELLLPVPPQPEQEEYIGRTQIG